MQGKSDSYIGRFAPSPTGQLHFGSLLAAVASYLQAKRNSGLWLVRMENIDPPREVKGSADSILNDLGRLGMESDGPVLYQESRVGAYREAREQLSRKGLVFKCSCTRASLPDGPYPGTCRNGPAFDAKHLSARLRVDDEPIEFADGIQGVQRENLSETCGDFVIWRSDGLPAYQLAVVVDDAHQGITEVVRGADLLDSTPRQIFLQRMLGFETPRYLHLPVVTVGGRKLGKRFGSDPVSARSPVSIIRSALEFLGQSPPDFSSLEQLWSWAIDHWDISLVPGTREIGLDVRG